MVSPYRIVEAKIDGTNPYDAQKSGRNQPAFVAQPQMTKSHMPDGIIRHGTEQ